MECLIGLRFRNFVLLAGDMTQAQSIVVMKTDYKKLHSLSDQIVLAVCGEQGDTTQFAEYIAKNIQLYKMRNGYNLSPKEAAYFTRRNLADALRSKNSYHVNMIIAGYDKKEGPQLFFMDYLASLAELKYACHGYGGLFSFSIMDRYYNFDMTREEAYELLKKCVAEIHKRLIVNLPYFYVQCIDEDGIHELPKITPEDVQKRKVDV